MGIGDEGSEVTDQVGYDLLDGVRVVEVASWLFAPSCGAILADWGADVIKVEPTANGGDPYRGFFHTGPVNPTIELANRGKRSIAVNLSTEGGREVVTRLVSGADVFVTSLLPERRRRLGLDVGDLRAVNPDLIYVRASGYGPRGPDAEKPGFDAAAVWARPGFAAYLTPEGAASPIPPPGGIGDCVGGLSAAGAVAAALFKRERSGRPSEVDVSLLGTGIWMNATILMSQANPGPEGPIMRRRERRDSPNPLVNNYRTRDGRWIALVVIQPDPHWESFCSSIGREDLYDDSRFGDFAARREHGRELVALLDEEFGARTLDEWRDRLRPFTGVWAVNQSPDEVLADDQVLANGYLVPGRAPGPALTAVASPAQFGGRPSGPVPRAPQYGEHTEGLLLDAGYTWEQITQMKESGSVL